MDFESYWNAIDEELASVPARAVLEQVPARTTEEATFYDVRLSSIGPYRISGFLSIPAGQGPFPAVLQAPQFGSVNQVPHPFDRSRYVVFAAIHRGQRLADDGFEAQYPGLLAHGIEDPDTYIYRGIAADCLRAAEFLFGLAEVDPTRVAVTGNDLALLTAARRPGFSTVRAGDFVLYRAMEARLRSSQYPLEELNDELRAGTDAQRMVRTLSYFDLTRHAPAITAKTLLAVADPAWFEPLTKALPDPEVYQLTHLDGTDLDQLDAWLSARLGVPAMSRFLRA